MAKLGPKSAKALDDFCADLSDKQAAFLRNAVERVCEDPVGRGNPGHSFTQKFREPRRYLGSRLPADAAIFEFKPNQYRGLFIVKDGKLAFLPMNGQRFFTVKGCPWH